MCVCVCSLLPSPIIRNVPAFSALSTWHLFRCQLQGLSQSWLSRKSPLCTPANRFTWGNLLESSVCLLCFNRIPPHKLWHFRPCMLMTHGCLIISDNSVYLYHTRLEIIAIKGLTQTLTASHDEACKSQVVMFVGWVPSQSCKHLHHLAGGFEMDSSRSNFKVSPATARFDNKQPGLADRTHCHHIVTSFQPVDVGRIERQNSSINMQGRSRIQYLIFQLDFPFAWEVLRGAPATGIQCMKCKSHRYVVFAHSPAWRSHQSNHFLKKNDHQSLLHLDLQRIRWAGPESLNPWILSQVDATPGRKRQLTDAACPLKRWYWAEDTDLLWIPLPQPQEKAAKCEKFMKNEFDERLNGSCCWLLYVSKAKVSTTCPNTGPTGLTAHPSQTEQLGGLGMS